MPPWYVSSNIAWSCNSTFEDTSSRVQNRSSKCHYGMSVLILHGLVVAHLKTTQAEEFKMEPLWYVYFNIAWSCSSTFEDTSRRVQNRATNATMVCVF